ncbi:MAG: ABC transporter ATP-binding protein [Candidatus Firestonebacteria bacterium]
MKNELLEIANLSINFYTPSGALTAVDGIKLSVGKKETVCLVGESGSGKTVSALAIMRLVPKPGVISSGEIIFNGENLLGISEEGMRNIRGAEISMVFQEPFNCLNPVFRVCEQIGESVEIHLGLKGKKKDEKVLEVLKLVGIPDEKRVFNSYPHELSGGMRQRVMIAMGLVSNPALLIADEPTTALDVTIQAQILELLAVLKEKLSLSILLITHDLGIVNEIGDRVYVLYAGRIMEKGTKKEIFNGAKHPYTEGLLKSVPDLGPVKKRLYTITGNIPDLTDLPKGCRFHPRCPYVTDICRKKDPLEIKFSDNHSAWCFRYSDGEQKNG